MGIIKNTTCKCGAAYADFENQLGCCPACSTKKDVAEIGQKFLKNLTYLTTDNALRLALIHIAELELQNIKPQQDAPITRKISIGGAIKKFFIKG